MWLPAFCWGSAARLVGHLAAVEGIKELTEITLALLLFADASTLSLKQVSDDANLPLRLLTIGLIVTIAFGTVVALGLLPGEGLAFAALLGAILAPTDAAWACRSSTTPACPFASGGR